MIVYKIVDNTNGKIYVGKTTRNAKLRISEHKYKKTLIGKEICEKGAENFSLEVLETCENEKELSFKEEYWILELDCLYPKGYNKAIGTKRYSEFNGFYSKKHSEETILNNRKNQPFRREVVSLVTGETFPSVRFCANKTGESRQNIIRHCKGNVKEPRFKYAD